MDEYKKQSLGYLPVILCWILRVTVGIWCYMYNSKVAFYHLLWVVLSFFIPSSWFFHGSVFICLPLVCLEFSLIYISRINSYAFSKIFQVWFFGNYEFQPVNSFWELTLMFSILILLGLMYPARQRFLAYERHHKGSDMQKDLIVSKIQDKHSSILWNIMFICILEMHNLVIFLMLFATGSETFNLFQLGFMLFFVVYSASEWVYRKTSIVLPIFIGFFIMGQYWWSVSY